jgi:DNA polymerase-3 subunit alpha
VAVYTRKDSKGRERQVVSVDKYDAEHLNVLKADFLGLTTMGIIRRALEMIGMPLEKLYAIPLDDPITLRGFKVNDVVGVFQFDGRSTKSVNREVKPDNFMEIADVNALSRPGPLHSGTAGDYIAVKAGMQQPVHFHPLVDDITGHTKGCIVYQEQILQLVRVVGGFPWTHASEIRRIISQKKGEAAFNKMEGMFIEGAAKLHNIDRETALAIWKRLVTAGTYAFNSAHSVSYGMLAFWTMWLKLHHTQAFFAAALTKADDVADVRTLLRDAVMPLDLELRQPLSISPPDVVRSGVNWLPDGERGLLAGFSQVPGIGEKLAERIVEAREENPKLLMVWEQLENVNGFGPAKMQMVREFSAKEDPFEIYKVQRKLDVVRAAIRNKQLPLPTPTHTSNDLPYGAAQQAVQVTWVGIPTQRNLRDLYEYHRSRTGEELDPNSVKDNHLTESMVIYAEDEFDFVNLTINRWKYPHFKAAVWGMKLGEDVLVVKGKKLASFGRTVHVESLWVLSS